MSSSTPTKQPEPYRGFWTPNRVFWATIVVGIGIVGSFTTGIPLMIYAGVLPWAVLGWPKDGPLFRYNLRSYWHMNFSGWSWYVAGAAAVFAAAGIVAWGLFGFHLPVLSELVPDWWLSLTPLVLFAISALLIGAWLHLLARKPKKTGIEL